MTTPAAEPTKNSMYNCLKQYLLQLEMSVLQAFKALLLGYREYLETYIKLLSLANIDFNLESYILNLKQEAKEAVMKQASNVCNDVLKLLPAIPLANCLGAGNIATALRKGEKKMKAGLLGSTNSGPGGKSDVRTRYEISVKIGKALADDLQETLDYIDFLIGLIDDAIAAKATPGGV